MKVAILGGSFNPPHKAHTEICQWVRHKKIADEIWIIPCLEHPFGKALAPFEDRLEMCRLAFSQFEHVDVMDVEKHLGGKSVTTRTLEHLRENYPDVEFILLIGSDVEKELPKWNEPNKLKRLAKIVVIPRGPDSFVPDISSTEIRYRCKINDDVSELLEPQVANYIRINSLYKG